MNYAKFDETFAALQTELKSQGRHAEAGRLKSLGYKDVSAQVSVILDCKGQKVATAVEVLNRETREYDALAVLLEKLREAEKEVRL